MAARIRVGRRIVLAQRLALKPFEAAFVLRCSERDIRNMLRRGELGLTHVGRLRYVEAAALAARVEKDELAAHFLSALLEGRFRAPRAKSPDLAAPSLASSLYRL